MKRHSTRFWLFMTVNSLTVVFLLVFLGLHTKERYSLREFIRKQGIDVQEIKNPDDVFRLRDKLYNEINDGMRGCVFNKFDMVKRPINGYSLTFILKNQEGACGEFTRLLYHTLRSRGIKSRPVILYGLDPGIHSVLEVLMPGNPPFLVDTIRSVPGLHEKFVEEQKSIKSYAYKLNDYKTAAMVDLPYFQLYSYFNVSKLSYLLFSCSSYITEPFADWINYIYASVYISYAVLCLMVLIVINLLWALINMIGRIR